MYLLYSEHLGEHLPGDKKLNLCETVNNYYSLRLSNYVTNGRGAALNDSFTETFVC